MSLGEDLAAGLDALGVSVDAGAQDKLLAYLALLGKWNRVYNLTAIREPDRMLSHHVLDSLAVVPHIGGGAIADVGSGAGLPGIPIALARADWPVTLIESNHKKSAFLKQAAIELALANVDVREERVENVEPAASYDVVISRAFSDLAEFATLAGRLCARDGVLAAMKGVYPYEELAGVPGSYRVEKVVPLKVPGLSAERRLVILRRS
ncbi:MAG: 16S rRNA (guanine(527)-N(7))-methyltransferase RsmG [Burkholderiales bacterium]